MGRDGRLSRRLRLAALGAGFALYLSLFAGAAQADQVVCEAGAGAGQCSEPLGVAMDRTAGLLYVADNGNKRVDVFEADGDFLRAFGWDVAPEGAPGDTPADQLEVCTITCQAGTSGGGSGQFATLSGIDVDNDSLSPSFGNVYVYDGSNFNGPNNRVQRFTSPGAFVVMFGGKVNKTKVDAVAPADQQNRCPVDPGDVCQAGTAGTAAGHFASGGTPPRVALGPGGVVHVVDNTGGGSRRLQRFNHNGEPVSTCAALAPGEFGEAIQGLAVDSGGNFYLANGGTTGAVRKYSSACALLSTFHQSFNIQTLALDGADNLFVVDGTGVGSTAIYHYSPTGTLLRVFYGNGTQQTRPNSLAPFSSPDGDIFAAEGSAPRRVVQAAFPPPGPVIHHDPAFSFASAIGNTKATLNARINPEGEATKYHFQYVDEATYLKDIEELGPGHGFDSASATTEADVVPPAVGPGVLEIDPLFRLASVSTLVGCTEPEDPPQPGCLTPETDYRFRAVAVNGDGGPVFGPEKPFTTAPSFEVIEVWASEVGADSTQLHALVNPLNIPLSGHFQYVDEATYLKDVEEFGPGHGFDHALQSSEIDFGSGEEPISGGAQLHSLQPGTTYRYRLAVENGFGLTGEGDEAVFRTFALPSVGPCPNDAVRLGLAAKLADCRAYEMVSPPDKEGGEILSIEESVGVAQSAAAGAKLTYSSRRAFGDSVSAPFLAQYIATRDPAAANSQEAWQSHAISPPREGGSSQSLLVFDPQFKAFSEDLSFGWLRSDSEPLLDEGALPLYANLYRRDNAEDSYEAICPVAPPNQTAGNYIPEPQGFSADGETTVFRANDSLAPEAAPGTAIQLYGCAGGELRLLSVLPPALGGVANSDNSSAGNSQSSQGDHRADSIHNAVSADGQRVYWADLGAAKSGGGRLYLRERPFAEGAECSGPAAPCTVAVSESVSEVGSDQNAQFWTAAQDGSKAIFSFTGGPLSGSLYEFDAATASSELIAKGVTGVAGFSEDAARLYIVSTKELAAGGEEGEPNLYFYEAGAPAPFELVANLPGGESLHDVCRIATPIPFRRCSRATPDGEQLAFMSIDPLTGYDNTDAASPARCGEPGGVCDAEIYLYDATANSGAGELLCVSCNPGGGRPTGEDGFAAQLPTWETAFYATRALSSDGQRLFFDSFDPLVLGDTNGALDVYQWERAGKGGCETTDHDHFAQNGGCVSLISSGKSPRESEFMDASLDGGDVFFTTASSLLAEDPGLIDVYDARVEGGFPPPPVPGGECEGEACQSPPPAPQAPTPASSTFEGPGDPAFKPKPKPKRCPKGKRRVGKGAKARCVKKGKGGKSKQRRHSQGGRR